MAIQFKEIRQYLARNTRLSICFEDGCYHDYLMISDIPAEKYKDLYVYGIGMMDVEFSKDIYTFPRAKILYGISRGLQYADIVTTIVQI